MMYSYCATSERGVTLIQMAILLVLVSLMMVPFFQFQKVMQKQDEKIRAETDVYSIAQLLKIYAQTNGHYPVPANPTLPIIDPNAGLAAVPTNVLSDNCFNIAGSIVTDPVTKLTCVKDAPRQSYSDNNDRILIGAVPYTALGLKPEESLDQYGNKFMYAVTYGLTQRATFADDKGSIRLVNQGVITGATNLNIGTSYHSVVRTMLSDTDSSTFTDRSRVQFVVISHGQNRLGARGANGALVTCTTGAIPSNCSSAASGQLERANFFPGASGAWQSGHFRLLVTEERADTPEIEFNQDISSTYIMPGHISLDATNKLTASPQTFDDTVAYATTMMDQYWTPLRVGDNKYNAYMAPNAEGWALGIGGDPTGTIEENGRVQVIGGDVVADRLIVPSICNNFGPLDAKNVCVGLLSINKEDKRGIGGNLPVEVITESNRNVVSGRPADSQAVIISDTMKDRLNNGVPLGGCPSGAMGFNADGSLKCL
jgi:hypothetical protein